VVYVCALMIKHSVILFSHILFFLISILLGPPLFNCMAYANEEPVIIDQSTWKSYIHSLIEPIAKKISQGEIALVVDKKNPVPRIYHFEMEKKEFNRVDDSSSSNINNGIDTPSSEISSDELLSESGAFIGDPFSTPLPFTMQDIESEEDQRLKGLKIFWNVQSIMPSGKGFLGEYLFENSKGAQNSTSSSQRLGGRLALGWNRSFNAIENNAPEAKVEKVGNKSKSFEMLDYSFLKFLSPSAIHGLTYLSALASDTSSVSDQFMIYSPLLSTCRKILWENRGDHFLASQLSFEDLLFFSESPSRVWYEYVGRKKILVPRIKVVEENWDGVSSLLETLSKTRPESVSLPMGVRPLIHKYAPVPNSSGQYISPISVGYEEVDILRAVSKTPLTESGYSYYFIGRNTSLPYYKIRYDFNGTPRHILIASWYRATHGNSLKKIGSPPEQLLGIPVLARLESYSFHEENHSNIVLTGFVPGITTEHISALHEELCRE